VLDANANLSAEAALALLSALGEHRARVALFEQPTARTDFDGLACVRRDGSVLVAADESAGSAHDVARLARAGAADVVNLKISQERDRGNARHGRRRACARSGADDRRHGDALAMTIGLPGCRAGGFSFVDLDTPLFLAEDPFEGGFEQSGPLLSLASIERGHGLRLRELAD
jgi:hypothetical protein